MKIFITGEPGVGKTTLLQKILKANTNYNLDGCIVEEIKKENSRIGFMIRYISSDQQTLLASKLKHLSDFYISKYSINLKGLEEEFIPYMDKLISNQSLNFIIFDEIGRMQNASPLFLKKLDRLLFKDCAMISTIVYDDEEWARKYKNSDFQIRLNSKNREHCFDIIQCLIKNIELYKKLDVYDREQLIMNFNNHFNRNEYDSIFNLF